MKKTTTLIATCLLLASCGGAGDTSVHITQDQSQDNAATEGEDFDPATICLQCIGNAHDGITDEACLERDGLTLELCALEGIE